MTAGGEEVSKIKNNTCSEIGNKEKSYLKSLDKADQFSVGHVEGKLIMGDQKHGCMPKLEFVARLCKMWELLLCGHGFKADVDDVHRGYKLHKREK